MKHDKDVNNFKDIPARAWNLLEGVNLFSGDRVIPEESAYPMVALQIFL